MFECGTGWSCGSCPCGLSGGLSARIVVLHSGYPDCENPRVLCVARNRIRLRLWPATSQHKYVLFHLLFPSMFPSIRVSSSASFPSITFPLSVFAFSHHVPVMFPTPHFPLPLHLHIDALGLTRIFLIFAAKFNLILFCHLRPGSSQNWTD